MAVDRGGRGRRRPLRTGTDPADANDRVPSRTTLLNLLNQEKQLLKAEQIAELLHLDKATQLDDLRARLERMAADGEVICNRRGGYGLADKLDLIAGTVLANADGFGFLRPDEEGEDLYLSPYEMRKVLHGDRVLGSVVRRDRRGRMEGAIVSIIARRSPRLVGRFLEESGFDLVAPDDRRLHQDVLIPKGQGGGARPGDIVVCEIVEPPSVHRQPVGRIVRVLGDAIGPRLAVELAIETHGIPTEWPEALLAEAARIPTRVAAADKRDRVDLREVPLVTIDGEDARDFDDAVWCEPKGSGYRLLVAIADVSHYVQPGSALDAEAQLRGTSVYFPQRVVPMLPEALSNELCSLKPKVDRLAMVAELSIDHSGKTTRSRFYRAVIRSAARLTYHQVWDAIGPRKAAARKRLGAVLPHVEHLYALYQVMAQARRQRGALDFGENEVKIAFGEEGQIERIEPYERNDAHKLIEECMIAANVAAAKFLARQRVPALYRVHPAPPARKLEELGESLADMGLSLPDSDSISPAELAELLRRARRRSEASLIEAMVLRAQALAVYQPDNAGHFGLALDAYAHFTSPIRRYADLVVHRAIGWILDGHKGPAAPWGGGRIEALGRDCSMADRRAEDASRDAIDRLKMQWIAQHLGEHFDGRVTGVASFGAFVELDGSKVSGMIHVTQLPNDYYHFDPVRHTLTGEREGLSLRLADQVTVLVLRVDEADRRIDFKLIAGGSIGRPRRRTSTRPRLERPSRERRTSRRRR
ncbi:MAG: ribonuclease R [Lysobacterales bacterium]